MTSPKDTNTGIQLAPQIWDYVSYRAWLSDAFKAKKAVYPWYSYGVLAQRAGFQARDYLMRVMRGERGLSMDGAERLADALDLKPAEKAYFIALVRHNQAKNDEERDAAWNKAQHALARSRDTAARRQITEVHRAILSECRHLAVRSLLEMHPDPGDWSALGKRLVPRRSASSVRRSINRLQAGGLIEHRPDGLWHATEKSLATPFEVGLPAVKKYHRDSLRLASASLDAVPSDRRSVVGLTLGISPSTYQLARKRIEQLCEELAKLADSDDCADQVYQITIAAFPLAESCNEKDPQ